MNPTEERHEATSDVDVPAVADTQEEIGYDEMVAMYDASMRHLSEGEIVTGKVIGKTSNHVIIDVGYKSEGLVPVSEFEKPDGEFDVEVGQEVDVLLEKAEDGEGHVLLSKRKAERMKVWAEVERSYNAAEIIKGRVLERIKGGLTVDVGIRAFLPGSLVDIKPIKNLDSLCGEELEFKVISMDRRRNNVVLSRKAVLEKEFAKKKAETLSRLAEGVRLEGVVKNITDYGVFVDLGGIDGLLHITDISWGRVNHPSEHFSVGDEAEVVVLKFDPTSERVSLGYKQRYEDPWSVVEKKYPLGARVRGKVVSLVDYGAFVELEEGVEGLIHVSEMSWTKKVVNPSKILNVGDDIEAIVSELDLNQRRISLSLRQAERNPWEELSVSHPVGHVIDGEVRNLTEFGAFVQITDEIDGLIHVSDMSWTKRVKHPGEVLKKGDKIKARITGIDVENQRVSLSIKEFMPNEWDDFASAHKVGDTITGRVVNVTDFGLFVEIHSGLEGLAHVSEIDMEGDSLVEIYNVGDWVSARILRIEEDDKKIGLTMRGVDQPSEDEAAVLQAEYESTDGAGENEGDESAAAESADEIAEEPEEVAEASADAEAEADQEPVEGAAEDAGTEAADAPAEAAETEAEDDGGDEESEEE
ncbi:MAG: 30S ribosomal protein S1 [Thermoanaerobaculia bacterium]